MKFNFTYRHVDVSTSLNAYSQEQFERVGRLLLKDSRWNVAFSMGRYDYNVEVNVSGPWGHFKATATAADFYVAVDQAAQKLEKQFQRRKDQLQTHKSPMRSRAGQLENVNDMLEYDPTSFRKSA
ncbi:MAG: ribosome-associated translation inhibitor RaiA [Bdellovibrionaceae bacterium]|nr:ribosome-associated translation inhibitor RaiA [Pseudobdellovibrionaceae bacterium]